mgnify:CR=1 FL=1
MSREKGLDSDYADEVRSWAKKEIAKLKEENKKLKNVTGQMFVATPPTVVEKYREMVKELKAEMTELKDQLTYLEDDNCRYANALEEEYILKTDLEEEYVLKTTCDPNIPWFKSDYEELKDQLDIAEADLEEQANIVCEVKEENEKLKADDTNLTKIMSMINALDEDYSINGVDDIYECVKKLKDKLYCAETDLVSAKLWPEKTPEKTRDQCWECSRTFESVWYPAPGTPSEKDWYICEDCHCDK